MERLVAYFQQMGMSIEQATVAAARLLGGGNSRSFLPGAGPLSNKEAFEQMQGGSPEDPWVRGEPNVPQKLAYSNYTLGHMPLAQTDRRGRTYVPRETPIIPPEDMGEVADAAVRHGDDESAAYERRMVARADRAGQKGIAADRTLRAVVDRIINPPPPPPPPAYQTEMSSVGADLKNYYQSYADLFRRRR